MVSIVEIEIFYAIPLLCRFWPTWFEIRPFLHIITLNKGFSISFYQIMAWKLFPFYSFYGMVNIVEAAIFILVPGHSWSNFAQKLSFFIFL